MNSSYLAARSIAVTLLGKSTGTITRELIASKVAFALTADPEFAAQVDADALVRELEAQYSVWIGRAQSLDDKTGHVAWLEQKRGTIDWQYWRRYRQLLQETWPAASLERLDDTTNEVLDRLEDPERPGPWDRRGLVVGHVQSGKTAHYIGLINKAVDAGYKLVVVLAGIHKSLRSQTQIRLDEGFLGYESVAAAAASQGVKPIGVGRYGPGLRPNTITDRTDGGDFKSSTAARFQINPGGKPLLFVVKKNGAVLKNMVEWVQWAAGVPIDGRPINRDVPILVIDDEADNASVDTRPQSFDEQGVPDPEHDPTVINRRIRRLLHCFEKAAYVGYTATPFANIFIHEQGETKDEGQDLFPRSFIVSLPAPSDYVGPLSVFGLAGDPDAARGLPILRSIHDHGAPSDAEAGSGWMPSKHHKEHRPLNDGADEIPPTLQEAVQAFLLASAARRVRGQGDKHNSMLIHVTRFTDVQEHVYNQVKRYLDQLINRLQWGEGKAPEPILRRLQELWERDFIDTSTAMRGEVHPWSQVAAELWPAASKVRVKRINGTAPDILDYESHRETGLSVIAIGGDKLARGLTLEGLTVSYFLRATKMYDTLMQMGRWFGYRPGYRDLCRMYMTDELRNWFEHVTAANEELREEFDRMVAVGGTPRAYGLKVKSHPALLITAPVKMKNGIPLDLSFAGGISETVAFRTDAGSLDRNLSAVRRLAGILGAAHARRPHQPRPGRGPDEWKGSWMWEGVSAEQVATFLTTIVTHEDSRKVQARLLAAFIDKSAKQGELTEWTVAILGKEGDGPSCDVGGLKVGLLKRAGSEKEDRFSIQRLVNPRDEAIDLDAERWKEALELTVRSWTDDPARGRQQKTPEIPSGPMIRSVRPPKRGVLLIYLLENVAREATTDENGDMPGHSRPFVGVALSFPSSRAPVGPTVRYYVNNVYWEQEFGAPD